MSEGKILIVEDEPELAEMLSYSLQQAGFSPLWSEDGFSACRVIERERPDLILLDIMLPELDGWEVCRLLRSVPDEEIVSIPVVMLTALDGPENRLRGLELGADAYIAKPFSLREVLAQVKNLLARRRRDQELRAEMNQLRSREQLRADIQNLLFHELRNQLVVIGGFSSLLARSDLGKEQGRTRDYLSAIHRSSDYLSLIADEFQLVRRIENGRLELAVGEVDLAALVREVVALFHPLAGARGVRLAAEGWHGRMPLEGNRAALKVVFSNLVDNAIKFSHKGGVVAIRPCVAGESAMHGFEVLDCGEGITAEEQKAVFERFYRGRSARDRKQGSGLGLYVVRTLVEAIGGRVRLESREGVGSRFQITFPVTERRAALTPKTA